MKKGETKKEIIKLLSAKDKTLIDICRLLGLAPSTINQHLKELQEIGAVRLADDQHSRKWKYYHIAENFGQIGGFGLQTR